MSNIQETNTQKTNNVEQQGQEIKPTSIPHYRRKLVESLDGEIQALTATTVLTSLSPNH